MVAKAELCDGTFAAINAQTAIIPIEYKRVEYKTLVRRYQTESAGPPKMSHEDVNKVVLQRIHRYAKTHSNRNGIF